jgi:starch phosphorylase
MEKNYLGMEKPDLQKSFSEHLEYTQAKTRYTSEELDYFKSISYAVRDRLMERWNDTNQTYYNNNVKRVYYLSLEFLMGRMLKNSLVNLGIKENTKFALREFDILLGDLCKLEPDAGLGNGGLGRLAACFLDSMATLKLPGEGYGIRYDYGIFEQDIKDNMQIEKPESWLKSGYPWETIRPEYQYVVNFGGFVKSEIDQCNKTIFKWENTEKVYAMAYDIPIPGFKCHTVNTLRLWSAKASENFELKEFNLGDYVGAVQSKIFSEAISSVLYPKDDIPQGKELRLKQEYFFVSATIQDIIRRHKVKNENVKNLHHKVALQLNDTHPALAVPELMRILLDQEGLTWEEAWHITSHTCSYTNHTMMPEALEIWPVHMIDRLLPRHMQIIYEINYRFLNQIRESFPGDDEKISRVSIIQENPVKAIRMANLAIIGSHKVNGVSELHTELIKKQLFADFNQFWPDKFINMTNGITQRRWLLLANPKLAQLISSRIGDSWTTHLDDLKKIIPLATDKEFQNKWQEIKHVNKCKLSRYIKETTGITVNPNSLFDIQIKRIHEYKRQLLNILNILRMVIQIKNNQIDPPPRTFIFAGKAAPAYYTAKLIIRLINEIGNMVNNDPQLQDKIKVVFLKNYNVSLAELIIPAADLSEQISTAGMEASGTGNMKFSLNGSLTIGTYDGANIEICEEVGKENIFIFGLRAEEIKALKNHGYSSLYYFDKCELLKQVIEMIANNHMTPYAIHRYKPIVDSLLLGNDPFMVLADFEAYIQCQDEVSQLYTEPFYWTKKSILNTAKIGKFSSDRTISEYAREIWQVEPIDPQTKYHLRTAK